MRRWIKRGVVGGTVFDPKSLNSYEAQAEFRDGHRAAAWLIWRHRRNFRRAGYVAFNVGPSEKVPSWFRVAVARLSRSPRWSVEVVGNDLGSTYTVRWTQWRCFVQKQELTWNHRN